MTTASSRATTTRIGNSRQNDRFLRARRPPGFRPPEAVVPSGAASAGPSPSSAGPLASALVPASASALPLASALLVWALPASALPVWASLVWALAWSGASAPLSALDGRACSGSADAVLSPGPASGSAPGVTPRPAPLIRAPSVRAHRVPGPRPRQADPRGHRIQSAHALVGVHRHRVELSAKSRPPDRQPGPSRRGGQAGRSPGLITFPHVTGLAPTTPAEQEHRGRDDTGRSRHRAGGPRGR